MVKIEFIFDTKKKRNEVKDFYESLGLISTVQKNLLRIKGSENTAIVSAAQSKISLRAKNHREILETHKDLLRDLETVQLEEDVEISCAHKEHQIPFRIKLFDPLGNDVCISPALSPKTLGILTSGGDAPGMNSAIWAIVKAAGKNGAKTLGILNGFEGLINDQVQELNEQEAYKHMQEGGTFLHSARSKKFMTQEGLSSALHTIEKHRIDALIIIGGDGTMQGAGYLSKASPDLSVVFIPGSIDNDIPGTESIGAATALHRIIEAVDCIESTMISHRRGFVLEVMGRDCGWLALSGAFATDATYVFLPEYPQEKSWRRDFTAALQQCTDKCVYVILSEGAKHADGRKVRAEEICEVMEEAGIESRSTVLGHAQRGGSPCASDRILAPSLGVAAVEVALSRRGAYAVYTGETERVLSLETCIERCREAADAIKLPGGVVKVRRRDFVEMYETFQAKAKSPEKRAEKNKNFAVCIFGAVGAGASTVLSKMTEYGRIRGVTVTDFSRHAYFSRAKKGKTKRPEADPALLSELKEALAAQGISTLVLIGGLDALAESRRLFSVAASVYVIPCTVSNNVPGSSVSIGADTALDTITALCDNLKMGSSRNTAYIVEVHGGACGYLSVSSALAVGAIDCYFPEETGVLSRLTRSLRALCSVFKVPGPPQLIMRGNGAMKGVCNDTAAKVLELDGSGTYSVRQCTLGHVQKGNKPTAVDRVRAARTALFVFSAPPGRKVLGVNRWSPTVTEIDSAILEVNEDKRRVKRASWLEMARTYRVLN
ncbi:6-phosphofructokinase 1 [Nematocida major]|uniref:6-phosphofructokinase 1 n=1 Tax=Nematocida major TaxID=1912982 RepID=UPI00200781CA|nr:6-phosphofructokinase 1 [Nematocida major]KAH9385881.1 6-phosphofructokinase 1 [Nematocida major]